MSFSPPAAASTPMVEFERVSCRHGAFQLALADVSFAVGRGEIVVLRGTHGAGKSTLLRLVAALAAPSHGTVRVGGRDLAGLRPRAIPVLRQSMGIVPQDLLLLDDRSLLDNVMLPALAAGVGRREAAARAQAALQRVGLHPADVAHLNPRVLGGGDRQRVALARALVNRPALLLADEPTAQLDAAQAAAVIALLAQFAQGGVTVLVASRDAGAVWPASARQLHLRDGQLQTTVTEAAE
jgi:cell division transport system ATP-binding protein